MMTKFQWKVILILVRFALHEMYWNRYKWREWEGEIKILEEALNRKENDEPITRVFEETGK